MSVRRDLDLKPVRRNRSAGASPGWRRRQRSYRLMVVLGVACLVLMVLAVANLHQPSGPRGGIQIAHGERTQGPH